MAIERYPVESDDYYEDDECPECGGDGWVTADCFEDTCCCADPETEHGIEPCPLCNPTGMSKAAI